MDWNGVGIFIWNRRTNEVNDEIQLLVITDFYRNDQVLYLNLESCPINFPYKISSIDRRGGFEPDLGQYHNSSILHQANDGKFTFGGWFRGSMATQEPKIF